LLKARVAMIARTIATFTLVGCTVGCTLGGTGRPPGAGDDRGSGVDHAMCTQAMAAAPLASPGFDVKVNEADQKLPAWH